MRFKNGKRKRFGPIGLPPTCGWKRGARKKQGPVIMAPTVHKI